MQSGGKPNRIYFVKIGITLYKCRDTVSHYVTKLCSFCEEKSVLSAQFQGPSGPSGEAGVPGPPGKRVSTFPK